ncbi:MAG: hypothetical protein H5U38_00465 [Calditrichaeota bacterium]|nr:hypothetical protein [Calditrichota bacterium]
MTITVRSRISRGEQTSLRTLGAPARPGERPEYGQHGARATSAPTRLAKARCLTSDEGETQANFLREAEALACSGEDMPLSHLPTMNSHRRTFVCGGVYARMVGDSTLRAKPIRRAAAGIPRPMGVSLLGAVVDVASWREMGLQLKEQGRPGREGRARGSVARCGAPHWRAARGLDRLDTRRPWAASTTVRLIGTGRGRERETVR